GTGWGMAPASTEPCAVYCPRSTCASAGENIDSTSAIVAYPANNRVQFMTFPRQRPNHGAAQRCRGFPCLPLQRVKYLPPGELEPCICEWQLAHCWLITKIWPAAWGSLG